ncbi:MAG: hypothetical protein JNL03_15850 [Prolixibacteraceae bacterium]|nr:hypothetical protein [Prolixibacteraceae bacterium]
MKRIIYLIGILIAVTACKEVFEKPPQALLQASFLNSSTKKMLELKVAAIGMGQDSLWISETSLQKILLPLSAKDTTSFIFSFDSKIDTITFFHKTKPTYDSMDTGFYFEFKLDSIDFTQNRIDSIQISDSLVTQNWHENIKLYIRPLPAGSN